MSHERSATMYEALYPRAAMAMVEALAADPFYKTLADTASDDAAESVAAMVAYLDYSLQEADTHGILSFPGDRGLGAAAWKWPLSPAQAKKIAAKKLAFIERYMG